MKNENKEESLSHYDGKLEINIYTNDRFRWLAGELLSEKKYYEIIQGKNK